ncbi:MAG: hypothetical protein IKJ54_04530, partial [Anaerotignum sp.]|nr:hypothetical protein [Anaerotignum sp.]
MLDFEDVTPRKRTTDENNEIKEQIESTAEDIKNETIEESAAMQPETDAEEPMTENAEAAPEEDTEKEPVPQPSVREYHY